MPLPEFIEIDGQAIVQRVSVAMNKVGFWEKDKQQPKEQKIMWHFVYNICVGFR
jgi:hypothetical protein